MAYKDLGSKVSQDPQLLSTGGQFSAEERSYESVVIQENEPVIDWEMNLRSEIKSDYGLRLVTQKSYPSCFLTNDFLENSEPSNSFEFLAASVGNENKFKLKACDAIVNGWPIHIEYSDTDTDGENEITLNAAPASGVRTDLVILEVWRALIKAPPDTAHKSSTGMILRNGNAKAPDTVNLTDDLIDPTYAQESSARVQIQYRLRVIDGVDGITFPDPLDDTATVVANTAANPGTPDGTPTTKTYAVADRDKSLWIAGTGSVADATALDTVDGFMYAIPVCLVARRNSSAFSVLSNLNGGNDIASAPSIRPDGLFYDQIVSDDVKDLRKGCTSNSRESLEQATVQLFNNSLATELEIGGNGTAGTAFLEQDSINTSDKMGRTDSVRRHFSDRPISEVIVVKIGVGPTPTDSFSIDSGNFTLSWGTSTIQITSSNGNFRKVNKVRVVNTSTQTDTDITTTGIDSITFSGNFILIDTTASYSNVTIYVEVVVDYPSSTGTTRNIIQVYDVLTGPAASIAAWVDSSIQVSGFGRYRLIPNGASVPMWDQDPAHREAKIQLQSIDQIVTAYTSAPDELWIPERLNGESINIDDGINNQPGGYPTTSYTQDTAYTKVTLTGGISIPAGSPVTVTYKAIRAMPHGLGIDFRVDVVYQTRAIQSLQPPSGVQTLELIPRAIGDLYAITAGSGSPDSPATLIQPGAQLPIGLIPAKIEAKTDGPSGDFIVGLTLGFAKIETYTPYNPDPQSVTLYSNSDVVSDGESRHFWPRSDDGTSDIYSPIVKGTPYVGLTKHKTVLPTIMELKSDFDSIGKKGTLVLVAFIGYDECSKDTEINLTDALTGSAAAIYRIRGNFMNMRRVD